MIRVLLAEDMVLLRGALVSLLAGESDVDVVGEVSNGEDVLPTVREHQPDVVVLDAGMPGIDGLAAAAQVLDEFPQCKILILTAHGKPETLRRAVSLGVNGFMLKDDSPEDLAAAIRRVAAGEQVMDPQLATAAIRARENPLSARETDVLRVASEGAELSEIASRLHLAEGTVRNYLGAAVTKLAARNRIDAVRIATDAGWM